MRKRHWRTYYAITYSGIWITEDNHEVGLELLDIEVQQEQMISQVTDAIEIGGENYRIMCNKQVYVADDTANLFHGDRARDEVTKIMSDMIEGKYPRTQTTETDSETL